MPRLPLFYRAAACAVAILSTAPGHISTATAASYDMDCKLILCLPAGFPQGCGDALDHMLDRLGDGKSPIGFCAMSDGKEFDDYEIDHRWIRAQSRSAWECPETKHLHHSVADASDNLQTVTAFCYDRSITRRFGDSYRTTYSGISTPARTDFMARIRINPGGPSFWDSGLLRFYTGRNLDWATSISHRP